VRLNKVLNIEDFDDPAFIATMREVLTLDPGKRIRGAKAWEITQTVRALRKAGVLRRDAEILGVGAGSEVTTFYLTNHVKRVFSTDLYADGVWTQVAPPAMLVNPGADLPARIKWDRQRLIVQHMDGRELHYPDETFDGIYSNGSVEHFGGGPDDAAKALREMGRVVKRGGIVTLSTEFRLRDPGGNKIGVPGAMLFTPEMIQKYLIGPSGLRPIDPVDYTVSPATLALAYPLTEALSGKARDVSVALTHEGFAWTSIFLALVKD
jgi:SAM-dependent methyltransferase